VSIIGRTIVVGMKLGRSLLALAAMLASHTVAADQTVQVGPGLSFSPATVTVAPGETVTWSFQALHTSTSDEQTGPETWDSGLLSSGTFSHTFQTPGDYPYYCAVHSSPGGFAMNGVVVVSGAGVTATPTPNPTATQTPNPTATQTPNPTATPAATSTPIPVATPPASGIPDLDVGGRAALALALVVIGLASLLVRRRP
jgi:plastocyanin